MQMREPDDPLVARRLNRLAATYRELGREAEARPLSRRAYHIWLAAR
jgi:hypothetical protein